MTAELVNLRRARKAKQRVVRSQEAAANRALHGRGKAERELYEHEAARAERLLDHHRLDAPRQTGADDPGA